MKLGSGLSPLYLLHQSGDDAAVIGNCTVMGDVKDGSALGVVDGDDAAGILHAHLILDGTGNGDVEDVLGLDGGAALADLLFMGQPAVVHQRTGGGQLAAQKLCQFL